MTLKDLARRVPGLESFYRGALHSYEGWTLAGKNTQEVFSDIFRKNRWAGSHSVSGTGSDDVQTRVIAHRLPELVSQLDLLTLLDIPCGDFHWMSKVDLKRIEYMGADIVDELIADNIQRYSREDRKFVVLDLIRNPLPEVDLLFCRDCLVHLSFADIRLALQNICDSGSQYLLTTTFTDKDNFDIRTGQWRPINLERAPFHLPPAIMLVNEECTEGGGSHSDKSMGLWRVADIKASLALIASDSGGRLDAGDAANAGRPLPSKADQELRGQHPVA